MDPGSSLFFCGIGGSGMAPLALMFAKKGYRVSGSDRAYDRGLSPEKFKIFKEAGIALFPQDGSGVHEQLHAVIVSSAVEESVPDIAAAREKNIPVQKRAALLAGIFNAAETGISVAGTSGKSTVTGMVAWVLTQLGKDPSVMNGAVIKGFEGGNMRIGSGGIFVTETDESDGSIDLFNPALAVLNNIALDHKSIKELEKHFGDFIARAGQGVVANFDDSRVRALSEKAKVPVISYGFEAEDADLHGYDLRFYPGGTEFKVGDFEVSMPLMGAHNVLNALACLATMKALGADVGEAVKALAGFHGIKRRLEVVGTHNDITVIDDFAHNPDKIAATLKTLKAFEGRLIVIFQPHGYGPLKLLGKKIAGVFTDLLDREDILIMPEVYYAGGTADKSVTSEDVIENVKGAGKTALWFERREEIVPYLSGQAKEGDRIVVMGARDDTLSDFAKEILDVV